MKKAAKICNGLDPNKTPPIYYCKKHRHFTNLQPHIVYHDKGDKTQYRVVCGDCNAYGPWESHPIAAIEAWNKDFGTCLK
jgi:hypothetical protein